MMTRELGISDLRRTCSPDNFSFETTKELEPLKEIIGQDRALDAIELGLGVKDDENRYNIYVAGQPGTGKNSAVNNFLKKVSKEEEAPPDICYIHNFENPDRPQYLQLEAGKGCEFKDDMDELVEHLEDGVSDTFETGEYKKRKEAIDKQFNQKKKELFEQLEEEASEKGFILQRTPFGLNTVPKAEDGEPMDQQEFSELEDERREELEARQEELQSRIQETMQKVMEAEEEQNEKIQNLKKEAISFLLDPMFRKLQEKYKENEKAVEYLRDVKEDILENIDDFTNQNSGGQPAAMAQITSNQDQFVKYRVNVLINNGETEGAPVVTEDNATYPNLFGAVEKKAQFGMMSTDFTMIKPGALHEANGGYLVVRANNLFRYGLSWEGLKVALNQGEITIEDPAQMLGYASTKGLQPEPIPLNIKVVIIGNRRIYNILNNLEEDFQKLFNVKSDFDFEMDWEEDEEIKIARFIRDQADNSSEIKHFNNSGVAKVVEYSSEMARDKEKLSTKFSEITELVKESSYWAKQQDENYVDEDHVKKAMEEKIERRSLIKDKIHEYIDRGKIFIDTKGKEVGQITGLSVLSTGDFSFGKPARITASVYAGKEGVVNIDREADLSGSSHTKGVMILKGYLGKKFAYDKPLSLTANIAFEQSYSKVDGDSASSTELYAIISSLADVEINQGIAVTGSVNQKGEIQPIGGAKEKVEGFYEVCKAQGLTGDQGVILPEKNVDNLMLNDEVIDSVDSGDFHIYPAETVSEGLEILTGMDAGAELKDGGYEEGTIFARADEKIREIYDTLQNNEDEE
ncbi:MAG: ATP-binding protein [Candidatus Bipolaricaulota bacterium]|nr:AAA family ATPase [Candidatus Bipolaricaulota bacterium]MBS3791039.1 AAA family ATPase [Candidatus Bipolaricaulota bacterium]